MSEKSILYSKLAHHGQDKKRTLLTHADHAVGNTTSLRKAVNALCWNCAGGGYSTDDNKGVRTEIKNCPITKCPAYFFRPYKRKEPEAPTKVSSDSILSLNNHCGEES